MLKEERFQKLLSILDENEFITVKNLSEKLEVSMPTVRRDLAELAARNQILRSHGGAMRMDVKNNTAPPIDFRRSINAREKAAIARAAAAFLRSDSVIFIDASTTAAYLTEHLEGIRGLIVITNSLMTAVHLKNRGVRTYCLGGEVLPDSLAVGGRMAVEAVGDFNIDVMFFSSYGVNAQGVIVDSSEAENELRRHVLRQAASSVFLCDRSKFGKSAAFHLAPLGEVDYLISDGPVPESFPAPRKGIILAE